MVERSTVTTGTSLNLPVTTIKKRSARTNRVWIWVPTQILYTGWGSRRGGKHWVIGTLLGGEWSTICRPGTRNNKTLSSRMLHLRILDIR